MANTEIFHHSDQGSDTAGETIFLPTSQWLLEAPAKFLKQKVSHAAHIWKALQPKLSITTAGLITNRRKLIFFLCWAQKVSEKVTFLSSCVWEGHAKPVPACLRRNRNPGWDGLSSSGMETSDGIAPDCLPSWSLSCVLLGNSPQPSGRSFGRPHSPCSPLYLPNMFPSKN